MPVVAIGIALAADAFAIGTGAALLSFTTIAAVGATIGAIGVVTHDKTLTTIGTVLGAVGGIGSLASSAGLISDLGTSAVTSSEAAAGAVPAAVEITPEITGTAVGGFLNPATEAINALAAPTAASMVQGATGILNTTPVDVNPLPDVTGVGDAALAGGAGSDALASAPTSDFADQWLTNGLDLKQFGLTNSAPDPSTLLQSATGANAPPPASGMLKFLESSGGGQLAGMGLMAGASFLSGATNPLTPAQVAAYQAQAAVNTADAKQKNLQASNMGQKMPVASLAPVTGAPQVTPVSGAPAQTPISGAPALTAISGMPLGIINAPRTVGATA